LFVLALLGSVLFVPALFVSALFVSAGPWAALAGSLIATMLP
jgi:hypothetical protein